QRHHGQAHFRIVGALDHHQIAVIERARPHLDQDLSAAGFGVRLFGECQRIQSESILEYENFHDDSSPQTSATPGSPYASMFRRVEAVSLSRNRPIARKLFGGERYFLLETEIHLGRKETRMVFVIQGILLGGVAMLFFLA